MNLLELLATNPDLATLRTKGLVFTPVLAMTLDAIQQTLGPRPVVVEPILMTTGNFALGADLLTEIQPGGLFHAGFGAIPMELLGLVEVIDWTTVLDQMVAE
jgi:hypothetical protein